MKKGFYTIMSAQFFSSLADNALLVAAIEMLKTTNAPSWNIPALGPMFALFYVILAPFLGAFADAVPKGKVMFYSNAIKVAGCLLMLFGGHPLIAYAIVGLGACCLCLGLMFTMPLYCLSIAVLYRDAFPDKPASPFAKPAVSDPDF